MTSQSMSKCEREDLQRLIRQREKVLKSAARQRSADLLADFDIQLAAEYRPDNDVVWQAVEQVAQAEVAKAQAKVVTRCRELGIPKQFAPGLDLVWHHRGYGNALKQRREELRRVAQSQIEALEQKAIVQIEMAAVEAQTQLARAGLTSEAAVAFVASLPSVEGLMPELSFEALAGESEEPLAAQLISNNAERQRRYRDRQRALRDTSETSRNPPAALSPSDE